MKLQHLDAAVVPSSLANYVSDNDNEDDEQNDELINEGIVGKKYLALKPYI